MREGRREKEEREQRVEEGWRRSGKAETGQGERGEMEEQGLGGGQGVKRGGLTGGREGGREREIPKEFVISVAHSESPETGEVDIIVLGYFSLN